MTPSAELSPHGLVFSKQRVLEDQPTMFFIVGRGGKVNTHKGCCRVRDALVPHALHYSATTKALRDAKAETIYEREFHGKVVFVISKDYFFKSYNQGKMSHLRSESILSIHNGFEAIRAYEDDDSVHYLAAGLAYAKESIKKLLCAAARELQKEEKEEEAEEEDEEAIALPSSLCSSDNLEAVPPPAITRSSSPSLFPHYTTSCQVPLSLSNNDTEKVTDLSGDEEQFFLDLFPISKENFFDYDKAVPAHVGSSDVLTSSLSELDANLMTGSSLPTEDELMKTFFLDCDELLLNLADPSAVSGKRRFTEKDDKDEGPRNKKPKIAREYLRRESTTFSQRMVQDLLLDASDDNRSWLPETLTG